MSESASPEAPASPYVHACSMLDVSRYETVYYIERLPRERNEFYLCLSVDVDRSPRLFSVQQ